MGWHSGSEVFDPVATHLQRLDTPPHIKIPVLRTLIRALQAHDWDTEYESLDFFRDDPDVVYAFSLCGISLPLFPLGTTPAAP